MITADITLGAITTSHTQSRLSTLPCEPAQLLLRCSWHGYCSHLSTTAPLGMPVLFVYSSFLLNAACPSPYSNIPTVFQSIRNVSDPPGPTILRQASRVFLFLSLRPRSISEGVDEGGKELKCPTSIIILRLQSPLNINIPIPDTDPHTKVNTCKSEGKSEHNLTVNTKTATG